MRFGGAMSAFSSGPGHGPHHLVTGYDWASLTAGSTIVDVGGSLGSYTIPLVEANPNLKLVVQDMPFILDGSKDTANVRFMAHDFFQDQPVVAEVYVFRFIFHNWADKYAVQILRALVPALKPGAKILVCDHCIPAAAEKDSEWKQKSASRMDMVQLGIQNGCERGDEEWRALFKAADPRFKYSGYYTPAGSELSIMDVTWTP